MKYPSPEFDAAVAAMCDGTADDAQQRALAEALLGEVAAQDAYLLTVELHARLASENALFFPEEVPLPAHRAGEIEAGASSYFAARSWLAIAAALIAAALVAWLVLSPRDDQPFARLVKSAGAGFDGIASVTEGGLVRGERFSLAKGSVELATMRGATVVLEAPAEFRFESAQRLHLTRGKAAADVPPGAKGFTIITPSGEVIDLGTKFGVDVAGSGASEVHVFKGEVVASATRAAAKQSLKQDQALALNAGATRPRELRTAAFIHADELQSLAAGLRGGRQARWADSMHTLRNDPGLLALLDLTAVPEGEFRRVQGRWPGTQAIEFTQPGDFLPVEFSGVASQLTLAAWVRLDRVPRAINSLLHTNGWGQPGQVHWMVAENQRMRFAVFDVRAVDQSRNRYPESSRLVTAATGRWTHLAVVYDAERQAVRFHIDGEFDNEMALLNSVPALLGPARVGNWNRQERILSGRLDELALFRRALSDAEIHALYEVGNPYAER